jgi:hypothetical protein
LQNAQVISKRRLRLEIEYSLLEYQSSMFESKLHELQKRFDEIIGSHNARNAAQEALDEINAYETVLIASRALIQQSL